MSTAQSDIPLTATILSTIGTVFWCIQLLPQIYHLYRLKSAAGVPASMMLLWSVSAVPFGAYDRILHFAIPLFIQPQIFGTLGLTVWAQCLHYGHGWSRWKATGAGVGLWAICGGIEAGLIVGLGLVYERGVEWPVTLMGVLAAVMLVVGFVPAWLEIVRRRGRVIGLNFVFLTIDWMGAFFSLMGVVTQGEFDILGGTLYIACAVIEMAIFISQGIWLARTSNLRKRAKSMGVNFDDLPEAKRYQWPRYTDEEGVEAQHATATIETKSEAELHSGNTQSR